MSTGELAARLSWQTLYGVRVIQSRFAEMARWEVQRHPIRKHRRNWRPVRVIRPGAYWLSDGAVLVVHPTIYNKLQEAGA